MIRSHPPPQAGCPLGDPGPLAVLTRVTGIAVDDSREVARVQVIDQRGFASRFEIRADIMLEKEAAVAV